MSFLLPSLQLDTSRNKSMDAVPSPTGVWLASIYASIYIVCKAAEYVTDKLYKLNNKILRILLNKNLHTPIIELYSPFNTLLIPLLHDLWILNFVHWCVHHNHTLPLLFITILFKTVHCMVTALELMMIYTWLWVDPVLVKNVPNITAVSSGIISRMI